MIYIIIGTSKPVIAQRIKSFLFGLLALLFYVVTGCMLM